MSRPARPFDDWWRRRQHPPGDRAAVAGTFADAVASGLLDLPLPGGGRTIDRWQRLAWWGGTDLSLSRLVEGHTDAVAILAELGAPALPPGVSSAVWAAEPPHLRVAAKPSGAGWELFGSKPWCSGASICDTGLVTVDASDGPRLMLVDLRAAGIVRLPPTWRGVGMAASDTESLTFGAATATAVGDVGSYLERPGFWIGSIGVAAVWLGGTAALARPLRRSAAAGRAGPHALAHLGRIRVLLDSLGALLERAARLVDARPFDDHEQLAQSVRSAVADGAAEVLDRVGRALGPGPLATDAEHAQRVADLTVYLRQHHADRDLARLGELDAAAPGELR